MANGPRIAWHYTIGRCLESILRDGMIRPATEYVPKDERPCVWLSVRNAFDPTARKMLSLPDGSMRTATLEETERLGGGLFRIGVDADGCVDFKTYARESGASPAMVRSLKSVAERQGAKVIDWRVSFEPLPRSRWLALQRLHGHEWRDCVP